MRWDGGNGAGPGIMVSVTCPETERRADSGRQMCRAGASRPDVAHCAQRGGAERSGSGCQPLGASLLPQGDVDGGQASQWGSGSRGPGVVACRVGCC